MLGTSTSHLVINLRTEYVPLGTSRVVRRKFSMYMPMHQVRLAKGTGVRARWNGSHATVGKRSGGWVVVDVEGVRLNWRSGHWEALPVDSSAVRSNWFASVPLGTLRSIFAQLSNRELGLISGTSKTNAGALRGMLVDVNIWECVSIGGSSFELAESSVRFLSFLKWVIRHRLKPRSFRAHLSPTDLLAPEALAVHCGGDTLTSMHLCVGFPGTVRVPSMLVPDQSPDPGPCIDLTSSAPSLSSARRARRWQEQAARTLEQSLQHRPARIPTVACVLSRFTLLETLTLSVQVGIMTAGGLLEALRPLHCLQTLTLRFNGVSSREAPFHRLAATDRLAFPHLPSLRELRLAGSLGIGCVLSVALPTLHRLDCSDAGKGITLCLYLECPLLQDVHLSRDCYSWSSIRCSFARGDLSDDDNDQLPRRGMGYPLGRATSFVVGKSCRGLYSTKQEGGPPSGSGPESLWRIPDGVRVTLVG